MAIVNEEAQGSGALDLPPGPFVTADWLEARLDDPRVRVLDTRGRIPAPGEPAPSMRAAYDAGHVPGAAFVTWNHDLVDPDDPVPNQLASAMRFAAAASALGIDADAVVVAYDDSRSIFAGRLWWAFRAMGHDAVRVLDGGWTAWERDGRPVSREPATQPARTFVPHPRPELRRTIDEVADRDPDRVLLLDARSRDRFAGVGPDPVGGHIPGARNVPYAELVGADGYLRPAAELRAVFEQAGVDLDSPSPRAVVSSCGSGISASVPLLALEVLVPGAGTAAAVYDGSWAEWSRSGRPIDAGTDAGA